MAKTDWLSPRDGEFLTWLKHGKDVLPTYKVALGLTDADVAALTADTAALEAKLNALGTADAAYAQAATDKTATRKAVEARARALVRRIKTAPGYTEAIGAQLKVLGSDDATDLSSAKPTLTAAAQPHGVVELAFNKSKSDGVNLYSQREGEPGYAFLARDTQSPYVDNRPLAATGKPETRKYKAVYVLGDDETGQFSDEVTVVAQA